MLQVGPTTVSFGTEPQQSPRKTGTIIALVVGGVVLVLLVVCGGAVFWAVRSVQQIVNRVQVELAESMRRPLKEHDEDYAEARKAFRTRLLFSEPSPQEFDPAYSPPGRKMHFRSGDLSLVAYVDPPPADGQPRPAVLFLHGGCAFGDGDWEMPQPYRDAGFIVMTPVLRGENGQAGTFTLFFDEVDDVLAAADALAGLPYVDKDSIFVSGHSAGGTLATLAAMASDRFRGAASLSGNMNQTLIADFAPFDTSQDVEFEMRSPISFPGSFKCPARLYYGNQEPTLAADTEQTARSASARGLDVAAESSPGDHFSSVPASIQKSIVFFNELRARRADPQ
jgi:dienelactone hydrolase